MKKMLAILVAVAVAAGAAWAQEGTEKPNQAQLAEMLVKALGMMSSLPNGASTQQMFEILMQNGIAPEGGWDASADVLKKDLARVLVQALGAEDEVTNPSDPGSWLAVLEEHGINLDNGKDTVLDMEALPSVVATDYGATSVDPLVKEQLAARATEAYNTTVEETSWSYKSMAKAVTTVTTSTTTPHKKKPTPH